MYWQQQQQQQQYQQNMQGRSSMRQASSGWGSPTSGGRPSLLDMSGNLRNDPGMRSPSYGNEGSLLGPGRGSTGLLPSPTGRYSGSQHDMLGQLDNDIDELVAAKVRLQQAMLSAAAAEGMDRQQPRQGYQQQGRFQNNQRRQQQQQQQDRRYPASGGQRGRDGRGGARAGGGRGGDTGRGGTGGGGRFGGGGAGGGERRGGQRDRPGMDGRDRRDGGRGDSRGQNIQRKRTSSEIYDPARPTEDEGGPTSIGRPVDDLQVTIRQESRGRAVVDDAGPARKKPMHSPRATTTITPTQQAAAAVEADVNTSWVCHVCNVTCRNIKVYQTHMTGKKHLAAMEKIREVATFESDQAKARLQAQNYLRKLDGSGGGGSGANIGQQRGNQRYCRECHRYFRGERVDHIKTDAHKNAKKSSKPHCSACNLTFKTSQKYVQHCKEEMHKKRRDQQLQGELSAEEENFVTVDAVGFDDDIDLDAELIEMEINAEDLGIGPETQPQEQEEQDAVIVIDSGDDKEPSDDAEADSAAVVEDDTTVKMDTELGQLKPDEQAQEPMVEEVAEDGASAQEGIDQASTAEPVDKPSQSEVPDVQVDEPAAEQATENTTEAEKGIATKMVTLSTEGPDSESKSGLENLKVTVTFDNQPSPDIPSASTEPGVSLETKVAGADVSPGGSKMVAAVGSGDSVKASADSAQDQSDQVGSAKVSSENEGAEPTAMNVEPTSMVSAASDQQQEAVTAQQEKQEKKQPQQEEIKELVFDPNQPVGEEYLVPVSGLFCKLCHKFLTSMKASNIHCKGKGHFQALKAELNKKKTAGEASTNDVDGQSNN